MLDVTRFRFAVALFVAAAFPPAIAGAQTFSYTGPAVPIPDAVGEGTPGPFVGAPITVSGVAEPVGSVTITIAGTQCTTTAGATTVGIDHTFVGDLMIRLRAPNGTTRIVMANNGGGGNNLCQAVFASGGGPIIAGAGSADAPFTGAWSPVESFAPFAGGTANGTWMLEAADFAQVDTGNIRAWSISFGPAPFVAAVPAVSPLSLALLALAMLAGFATMQRRYARR